MDILNRLPRTSADFIAKYGDLLLGAFGYDIIAINDYDAANEKGLLDLQVLNGLLSDKMVRIANYTRSQSNRIEISIELTPLGFATKTGAITRKIAESARFFQDESQEFDSVEPEDERLASSTSTNTSIGRLPAGITGGNSGERELAPAPAPVLTPAPAAAQAEVLDLDNDGGDETSRQQSDEEQPAEASRPMVWPIGGVSVDSDEEEVGADRDQTGQQGSDVLDLGGSEQPEAPGSENNAGAGVEALGNGPEWQGQERSEDIEIPSFLRQPRGERS